MQIGEELLRVRSLSDGELLSGLSGALRASRRAVAEVIAHLGEVEERRLHLLGGYSSMFAYCVTRLGMSEDEAYRRLEVARLARRFPVLFERLAGGHVSLSVAALLKPHLTSANHEALLGAVSGKTVQQAREVLASWFPEPDVLPSIRKLPARREPHAASPSPSPSSGASPGAGVSSSDASESAAPVKLPSLVERAASEPAPTPQPATSVDVRRPMAPVPTPEPPAAPDVRRPMAPSPSARASRSIEPLSAERYKVQLTAGAELKRKLELARDLLRHAVPSGDLAVLIERALDVLLEQTLKRRFAVTARPKANGSKTQSPQTEAEGSSPPCEPARSSPRSARGTRAVTSTPRTSMCEPPTEVEGSSPPCEPARSSPRSARGTRAVTSTPRTSMCEAPTEVQTSTPPCEPTSPPRTSMSEPPTEVEGSTRSCEPARSSPRSSRRTRYLSSDVRRAVIARDGARCTWRGPDGQRCDSRAWLEHDHIVPLGQGGPSPATASDIRIFCRAHNRLAAEQAYGQDTITGIIARRRTRSARDTPP